MEGDPQMSDPTLIAAVIGLLGALLGALVGGRLAVVAARSTADHEQQLRDVRSRASLVSRLLFMVEGTQTIGIALPDSDPQSATALGAIRELLAMWQPFDEMGSDLHLLGDMDLQRNLFVLCSSVRIMCRGLIFIEERAYQNERDADSGNESAMARRDHERAPVLRVRVGVREEGPKLAKLAQDLAARLRVVVGETS